MDIQKKLALNFVLNHPISFVNFFGPTGVGRFCRVRLYQEPGLLSKGGAYRGGRRWGKTFILTWKIIMGVFKYPRKQQLLAVFRRPHLKNVFDEVVAILNSVKFFSSFYLTGREYNSVKRDVLHEIRFKNRHSFFAIAVGDDPHVAMIKGKSPRVKYVDEAQDLPSKASEILSSTVDPEACDEYWAGVVDGRRDTPFFKVLERSDRYRNKIFKFSRRYDPHFNQDNLQKAIEDIEGGERSDRFGQEVDAEHGNPVAGVWNIDDLISCIAQPTLSSEIRDMAHIIITPRDYQRGDDPTDLFTKLRRSDNPVIIGADIGDAQPTMILPFVKENDVWVLKNRIDIRDHVDTVSQVDLFLYVIRQFPNTLGIGIDVTNNPAIADMLSSKDRELEDKIVRVKFNANVTYGFDYIRDEEQVKKYYLELGKR